MYVKLIEFLWPKRTKEFQEKCDEWTFVTFQMFSKIVAHTSKL